MSNSLTTTDKITAETLEEVLGRGDLSKLSSHQRVEYLTGVCKSLGLNPLTRPIRFMNFQGVVTPYATRDCADQLRKIHGISLEVADKDEVEGLFVVTARAKDKSGRTDEDMGAVNIKGLQGDARANAILRAITKAKRRVTLSICGMGFLDESELDTMPGAVRMDDAEVVRPPVVMDNHPELGGDGIPDFDNDDVWIGNAQKALKGSKDMAKWTDNLKLYIGMAGTRERLFALSGLEVVKRGQERLREVNPDAAEDLAQAFAERFEILQKEGG
jgi:hypothetical protein